MKYHIHHTFAQEEYRTIDVDADSLEDAIAKAKEWVNEDHFCEEESEEGDLITNKLNISLEGADPEVMSWEGDI